MDGHDSCGCKENGFNSCNEEACTCSTDCSKGDGSRSKQVIAVMSGKGGVGKSTVTALLASDLSERGYKVGILDADITGPSIPKLFGLEKAPASGGDKKLPPAKAKNGIEIISINLFLPAADDPVVWRGPIISGVIKQFWEETAWGNLDYLLVDLPPGTGDAPLTVMQTIPLDGVVIVTSPQDLANMVVTKAIKMAQRMGIHILGIIENMSYLICPDCGKQIFPFGESKVEQMCLKFRVPLLGVLPLEQEVSSLGDKGRINEYSGRLKVDDLLLALKKNSDKQADVNLEKCHVQ